MRFLGQAVAVVVATTLEPAQHAAAAEQNRYESRTPADLTMHMSMTRMNASSSCPSSVARA